MDWIRTMNNTPNISGTNGKLLHVTEEELAKHNKKTDCWMAISGRERRKEKGSVEIIIFNCLICRKCL